MIGIRPMIGPMGATLEKPAFAKPCLWVPSVGYEHVNK